MKSASAETFQENYEGDCAGVVTKHVGGLVNNLTHL